MRVFVVCLSVILVCLGQLGVTSAGKKCRRRGGTCQITSQQCSGVYWHRYCRGGKLCCIPGSVSGDRRCVRRGGRCQDETTSCRGYYRGGYCAGGGHRKCCLPTPRRQDKKCRQRGGTCQIKSKYCSGLYWPGYCNGRRRCCIPNSVSGDRRCIKKRGRCQDVTTNCKGHYRDGYCAGGGHRKCCLPTPRRQSPRSGELTDNCLQCICEVEGCEALVGKPCNMDMNSLSCGPFQIKNPYYIDCDEPGKGWQSCAKQMACSITCIHAYMRRYSKSCVVKAGRTQPTCQDYARIHNGGPNGCVKSYTLGYWERVNACCQRKGGC